MTPSHPRAQSAPQKPTPPTLRWPEGSRVALIEGPSSCLQSPPWLTAAFGFAAQELLAESTEDTFLGVLTELFSIAQVRSSSEKAYQ